MSQRTAIFSTSVGQKVVIGLTGFALFLYLVIHIAGNLIVFLGPEAFNRYAYVMEYGNPLLPVIELGLLAIVVIHIYKAVRMFLGNQQARPARYEMKKPAGRPSRKSFASSTMIASGLLLLVFMLIHVKAFRFSPEYEWPAGGRDLYRQELEALSNPLVVGFYLLAMAAVGSHLWHGIASSVQSLGLDHPVWTPRVLGAAKVIAILIAGAFMVIAVWAFLQHGGSTASVRV